MHVNGLELPASLCKLIKSGVWPIDTTNRQELKPPLGKDAAQKLSTEDDRIVLMAPPFHTIADELKRDNDFWTSGLTNVGEIDYEKAVIIADFGLGSDSPIILYYRTPSNHSVMYLRWIGSGEDIQHQWIETHTSFDDFARDVGLSQMHA